MRNLEARVRENGGEKGLGRRRVDEKSGERERLYCIVYVDGGRVGEEGDGWVASLGGGGSWRG
jgi:hypothetical protein